MNFSDLFTNFAFIGLMIVGVLGFIITSQTDNGITNGVNNNTLINGSFSNLRSNLTSFSEDAQNQKDLFESENPTAGFGEIILFSIVSGGKVFNSMIIGVWNILIRFPVIILGLDPAIIGVMSTLLIFTIIIGLWIIYKLGG